MMIKRQEKLYNRAFSLVEVVVALGIFLILASGILYVVTGSYSSFYGTGDRQVVTEFAKEGMEAVKEIRDTNWTAIENQVDLADQGVSYDGSWSFSESPNTLGDLTRTVLIEDAGRNVDGDISDFIDGSITRDIDTKKVTVTVSGPGIQDYVLVSYISNWQYRDWFQTSWTGGSGASRWSNTAKFNSETHINTASNKLRLDAGTSYFGDWEDLDYDAYVNLNGPYYDMALDSSQGRLFVVGSPSTAEFIKFSVSDIRSSGFTQYWSVNLPLTAYSIAMNPNNQYAYVGHYNCIKGGMSCISVVDTINGSYTSVTVATTAKYLSILSLIVSSDGSQLFALTTNGGIHTFAIGGGGATLTAQNAAQAESFLGIGTVGINAGILDEDNKMLYVVTDYDNQALIKVDYSNFSVLKKLYSFPVAGDGVGLFYFIYNPSKGNQIEIITEENHREVCLVVDDPKGGFMEDAHFDVDGGPFRGSVKEDGSHNVYLYDYYGRLYWVDERNPDGTLLMSDYTDAPGNIPYSFIEYSDTLGGLFVLVDDGGGAQRLFWVEKPETTPYQTTGNLVSSIYDLGSRTPKIQSITVNQNIPSGCAIDITLETDNTIDFSSPDSQVFSETDSYYTSNTPSTLDDNRFLRYQVDLDRCGSGGIYTPTLYDLKIKYK